MLPWHAIPFLKDLGMLTPNPWENRWPRLWRSCKWQKNAQLTHSIAPKEPNRQSNRSPIKWNSATGRTPQLKIITNICSLRRARPIGKPAQKHKSSLKKSYRIVKKATFFGRILHNWTILHYHQFLLKKYFNFDNKIAQKLVWIGNPTPTPHQITDPGSFGSGDL